MKNQHLIILLLLIGLIFAPSLLDWVIAPSGSWFRPYIIWLVVVVIVYLLQERKKPNDI